MNCPPGPFQWICQLADKALSGTSPDSQESLALLILLLGVMVLLVRAIGAMYSPFHPLVTRAASRLLRRPVREHLDEQQIFKAQIEQQAALFRQNQQQLDIMRQSFALSTDALVSIRDLTAEVKRSNDLETERNAVLKTDLAAQGARLDDLGTHLDGQTIELRRHIDATVGGLAVQISPVKAGIDKANTTLNQHTTGLNMLDQRMTQQGRDEGAAITALRETLLQRFDTLPAALAAEIRPLVDQWSSIERGVQVIQSDLKKAETRVIEAIDRAVGQREAWLADLAASAQTLGATKGNGA